MDKVFAFIVAQRVLIHRHRLFAFKLDALHHLFMRKLSARIEVFEYQSAVVGDQRISGVRMYESRNILDLALQSAVSVDAEMAAYYLA
jgi:hypothetical protein